jgi:hypothetical protein
VPYDNDDSPSTYDHASIDHRFNKLQSEMRDMSTATDNKLNSLGDKLEALGDKLSMETKVLGDKLFMGTKVLSDKLEALGNKLSMETKVLGDKLSMETKVLGDKLSTETKVLGDKLSMETKVLGTTMDAKTQSKFDALRIELEGREARFWARVAFTVSGLLCICYILPSNNAKVVTVASLAVSAAFFQYQNRAIQTPTIQTPAIQTPAVGQK